MKNIYFQPILTTEEWEETDLHSFEVYRTLEAAKNDFPNKIIAAYSGDDIENPTYKYEDELPTYYVDIPQLNSEEWLNVETFESREEAIDYATLHYNADSNGMVSLISVS